MCIIDAQQFKDEFEKVQKHNAELTGGASEETKPDAAPATEEKKEEPVSEEKKEETPAEEEKKEE